MADRNEFQIKLAKILAFALQKDMKLTLDEVKEYFGGDNLSSEQLDLVCDYLLSQKIIVKGYKKASEEEKEVIPLSSEEQVYVENYKKDIQASADEALKENLLKVCELAVEIHRPEVFIGDLIQEGNMGLLMAAEGDDPLESALASMNTYMEAQNETKRQDNKMVAKVQELDDILKEMNDEQGGKVDIDEVADRLGVEISDLVDILKLAGEETDNAAEDEE